MLTYQNAQLSDLPFIVDVYNSTIASRMVTADTQPVTIESKLSWFHQHNAQYRPLWIVKHDETPCGWVSLSSFYGRPAYNQTAEISIYLHPDYRGKKWGKQIVAEIEKQCPTFEVQTILCFIFGHNQPSIRLFTQLGYQQWGFLPAVAQLDNIKRDLVILGKTLTKND